jgi:aspartate-semialdehyde dehydrogenase
MIKEKYNIAIVGATGLVGRTMAGILEERNFPVGDLRLFASSRSIGKAMKFKGVDIPVEDIEKADFTGIDIALFSAGKDASIKYAPIAVKQGCIVVDNGSYWRMHPKAPLVVPEVNPGHLKGHNGIIANPNCSTIQLVVALKPILDIYGLQRVIVSTYQSITGAGQKGIDKLESEIKGELRPGDKHKIAYSTMFHEAYDENSTIEEWKMLAETRKIFGTDELKISVTCVRIPTIGGHGESVNIQTVKAFDLNDVKDILSSFSGIEIIDDIQAQEYATPERSKDTDLVYISRLRIDDTAPNALNMWVVSDNVRKGAATNAVQIAELIVRNDLFQFEPIEF